MNRIVAAIALFAAACITAPANAAEAKKGLTCKRHPTMTFADYAALVRDARYPNGTIAANPANGEVIRELPDGEYRQFIPRDLKIEGKPGVSIATNGSARVYFLPDKQFRGEGGIRFLGETATLCRVQDPTGTWWVVADGGRALDYFRDEDLTPDDGPPKK